MCSFSDRHDTIKAAILSATTPKELNKLERLQQDNLRIWGDYIIAHGQREETRKQVADWCDSQAVKS